jgi:hypothetical protein
LNPQHPKPAHFGCELPASAGCIARGTYRSARIKTIGPWNAAEPIRVFILDYFAYKLRAAFAEPFKRLVDVVHGEHDAEVAKSVHRALR